eukprot:6874130-Lingulodinium_polyedra.AAC.1
MCAASRFEPRVYALGAGASERRDAPELGLGASELPWGAVGEADDGGAAPVAGGCAAVGTEKSHRSGVQEAP